MKKVIFIMLFAFLGLAATAENEIAIKDSCTGWSNWTDTDVNQEPIIIDMEGNAFQACATRSRTCCSSPQSCTTETETKWCRVGN